MASSSTYSNRRPTLNFFFIRDWRSKTSFLVDMGASVSIIPRSSVSASLCRILCPVDNTLRAANGSKIGMYSYHPLALDLGFTCLFKWEFIITDVAFPILGANFFRTRRLQVDLRGCRLLRAEDLDLSASLTPADGVIAAGLIPSLKDSPWERFWAISDHCRLQSFMPVHRSSTPFVTSFKLKGNPATPKPAAFHRLR